MDEVLLYTVLESWYINIDYLVSLARHFKSSQFN